MANCASQREITNERYAARASNSDTLRVFPTNLTDPLQSAAELQKSASKKVIVKRTDSPGWSLWLVLSVLMYPCYLSVLTRANPCSPCSPCSSVGSVGKFSNNKIGGVVSVLLHYLTVKN